MWHNNLKLDLLEHYQQIHYCFKICLLLYELFMIPCSQNVYFTFRKTLEKKCHKIMIKKYS